MKIIIQVPAQDAMDLEGLSDALGNAANMAETNPFDGEAIAQIIVALGSATTPVLISWIRARVASRKSQTVIVNGRVILSGYTAEDVAKVVSSIETLTEQTKPPR